MTTENYDGGGQPLDGHELAEIYLAGLSRTDFQALVARVRPPDEPADPQQIAAEALRRLTRGQSITVTNEETP
ncbi:hypothetical protein ABQE69_17385 [Mycolicibacillus trivialis]